MTEKKKKTTTRKVRQKKSDSKKKAKKITPKNSPKSTRKTVRSIDFLEELLRAGCHFGHSVSRVNPRMQEYIFGVREGIHIFDLIKTKNQLEQATNYLKKIVSSGGKIIFVGTKRQAIESVERAAKEVGMFYVSTRWVGGLLTNWQEIKKNLDRLEELIKKLSEKDSPLTKYELGVLRKEQYNLESLYGGLVGLEKLPEAIIVVDSKKEQTAVREAKRVGVCVIGLVDTNTDPRGIDYVIPANDDAKASVDYILTKVVEEIKKAQNEQK